ncbi:MAG: META domain-containing protein [Steroidobacteraceae bacterium]
MLVGTGLARAAGGGADLLAAAAAAPPRPAVTGPSTSTPAPASRAERVAAVAGIATYRERIALTPGATFEAVLEDVGRADAPAGVLGRTRIDAPGQVPVRFAIAYDPARLRDGGSYIVRATIREGDRLAFTTDRIYRPFVDGRPQPLQIVMRAVSPRAAAALVLGAGLSETPRVLATDAEATAEPVSPATPAPPAAVPLPRAPATPTAPARPAAPAVPAMPAATAARVAPMTPAAPLPPGGLLRFASGSARLGALPAQFAGVLPCADCRGIRQTLDLYPDGGFHWRSEYLGKPPLDLPDDAGRWLFASDGRTLLLFGGREAPVRFQSRDDGALRLLDLEGRPIRSTLNYELRRVAGDFRAFEPRLRLRGAYGGPSDASGLLDCATGLRLPIAAEGDAAALERAWTSARAAAAGKPRIVLLEGRIVSRPAPGGPEPHATLVVDKFLRLAPAGESCPPPPDNLPLDGTRWQLTQLQGGPVAKPGGRTREAGLVFDAASSRISGSGGCNALAGSYALDGESLRVEQVAGTRTNCSEVASEQEKDFVATLEATRRWLVAGRLLELLDDAGQLIARFEGTTPTPATR